jgi:D-alanyl-D-alanine carboxypeptidase
VRGDYSNTNDVAPGAILNRITGQSLPVLVQERIARPLGLKHTYYVTHLTPYTGPGHAHGYSLALTEDGPKRIDVSGVSLGPGDAAGAILSP